ncbi:hypothetical protein N7467_003055 [Penicillium canescens]|nr:hypothetical protein N7467_003055 [Penicillium canescens]
MSLQTISLKPSSKPTTNRLRSACDACHQAKTKCSGTTPCLSCQLSATSCAYSPCHQAGRPKGSKNKQNMIEVNGHKGKRLESSRLHSSSSLELHQPQTFWPEPIDFDLTPSVLDCHTFVEELCNPYVPPEGTDNPLVVQSFADFIQSQSPFHTPSSAQEDRSTSSPCESGYATATSSVLMIDDPTDEEVGPCSCLKRHAHLVYHLGDLQATPAGRGLASALLEAVRRAQGPWKRLQECCWCQESECSQEVLLLFSVSIRILLSLFQHMHLWDPEGGQYLRLNAPSVLEAETDVLVGGFKVTGAVKAEVVNLLLCNALQQVLSALQYLQTRSSHFGSSLLDTLTRKSRLSSSHISPNRSLGLEEISSLLMSSQEETRPGSKRARV